jgi:hypothetical protein
MQLELAGRPEVESVCALLSMYFPFTLSVQVR